MIHYYQCCGCNHKWAEPTALDPPNCVCPTCGHEWAKWLTYSEVEKIKYKDYIEDDQSIRKNAPVK